ncbi:MAG: hypothetical protein FJY07_06685 [Bacteroidetes bacterium]|nr:hypothetical protein [Bacteroidota bacterium]
MTQRAKIKKIKELMLPVLMKYNIKKAGVFGSFANGTESINSDIDLLVELNPELSLIDYLSIKNELEDKTKYKIDLVEYETIKPQLREIILKQEIRIL